MSYNPFPQPADVIVISAGSSVTESNRFPVGIGTTGFVALNQGGNPVTFSNPLPVSLGSSSITINGNVSIPGIVTVSSSPENPIHNHITEVGTSDILTTPYLPIGIGTINLNLSYLPIGISSLLNTVTIGNTVSISNTAFYVLNPVTNVTVGGTVSIANTVSISNTAFYITGVGSTINISGTVAVSSIASTVTVQGTVGIGTTGHVTIDLNNSPVSATNPFPVTGTIGISSTTKVAVTLPPTQVDAFNRFRTSTPLTLFDSSHRYRDNNLWTNLIIGAGSTVGFVTTKGLIDLGIGTTAGCSIIRETTKVFSYQPGKSLSIMNTFIMNPKKANLRQRVGYFGADNGIYFEVDGDTAYFVERSLSTGTETRVPQSQWLYDTLLGVGNTNPSGITLNTTQAQIFWMDIEWLGVGSVRVGFVIDGQFIHCHSFHHANKIQSTYITTGSLPLRYEIANTGITTSSSTLKQVCSTVISEGGYELRGLQQAVQTPITTPRILTVAGTYYPIASLRLKTSPNRLDAIVIITALSIMGVGNGINYNWQLRASGTTTGGSWVSAGDDSAVEYNITGTSYSGGRILGSGFINSSNQGSPSIDILKEALFKFQLERDGINSIPYETTLVIAASPISSSEQVYASIDWEEISR